MQYSIWLNITYEILYKILKTGSNFLFSTGAGKWVLSGDEDLFEREIQVFPSLQWAIWLTVISKMISSKEVYN